MQIPLSRPDISKREKELVNEVLSTPYLSMGPMIERFERGFADYIGTSYAVGVNSGTSGLHLCIKAAGVGEGDEVITTPFSFVASANCILYERARPVFVDIDRKTLNIDVGLIEERITSRTRAILPVHVFGQPCPMPELVSLARKHGLVVIEDACEAIGAEFEGRKVGTFGDCAVFSFYPNKQMTTGEGAVIVTDKGEWAALYRSLRNQGRGEGGAWLSHERLGYNYRLNELSSALGVAQLERIEELLAKRQRVAQMYTERLKSLEGVEAPFVSPRTTRMSWFIYVIRLAPGVNRDRVMAALEVRGVASRPYFAPIHLQPFYVTMLGCREGDFPVTEEVGRRTLALPFHGNLNEVEIDYVCDALAASIRRSRDAG